MAPKREIPVITKFDEFGDHLSGYLNASSKLVLLLDYDGTLAPISDNPNCTAMPPKLEKTLNQLAGHPQIFMGVISGRGIVDVQNKVGIRNITYGGNHGIEIQNADGSRSDYQLPAEIQEKYQKLVQDLRRHLAKNGAWVEDKRVSLTYHYRDTPDDLVEEQRLQAIKIIESHGFRANQAHSAIEAKPPVNWNKGEAALFILKKNFGDNWAEKVKVIFAGDDTTDEDAMRVLHGSGRSFRVAANPEIETYADFRLPAQSVVTDFLQWIASVYN